MMIYSIHFITVEKTQFCNPLLPLIISLVSDFMPFFPLNYDLCKKTFLKKLLIVL